MAQEAQEVQPRQGREGNRWFNERPGGDAVAEWFGQAVKLPEGLSPDDYVGGVVLIPAEEKANEMRGFNEQTGAPIYQEVKNLVFTPYVKVETRVQYWHDLLAKHRDDWLGVIEPVRPPSGAIEGLPPGFSRLRIRGTDGKETPYVLCTMKATVFDRKQVKVKEFRDTATGGVVYRYVGPTFIDAAPATKQVPMLGRWGPDDSAIMKAETGAIGRALGMAGMLIVPGTGVATAEDMREAAYQREEPALARQEGAAPPSIEGEAAKDATAELSEDELRTMAVQLNQQLRETNEPAHTAFLAWYQGRDLGDIKDLGPADLKVVIKKLEKELSKGA